MALGQFLFKMEGIPYWSLGLAHHIIPKAYSFLEFGVLWDNGFDLVTSSITFIDHTHYFFYITFETIFSMLNTILNMSLLLVDIQRNTFIEET